MLDPMIFDVAIADRAEKLRRFERAERLGLMTNEMYRVKHPPIFGFLFRGRATRPREAARAGVIPAPEA